MSQSTCKHCGGKLQRRGKYKSNPHLTHTWCTRCRSWDYEPSRHPRPAKILLLDIETRPGVYYAWNPKQEYLSPEFMIQDWSITCWAAKWLFDDKIMGESVTPKEAARSEDGSILQGIWDLVDQAQIVITQNGTRFDMPRLNSRWIDHGYPPPSYYRNVDTLKVAQSKFGWTYNRLEELGKRFGIGEKIKMNLGNFIACANGDKQELDKMLVYCKRDVAPLLEDVYLHMLPWMDNHPNMNIFTDTDSEVCKNCGSSDLIWGKEYQTPQALWEGWRCNACGAIGRGKSKEHRIKKAGLT